MKTRKQTLLGIAVLLLSGYTSGAQSYSYSGVKKNFHAHDGFGIPHEKEVAQEGKIILGKNEISIDGDVYRLTDKNVLRNEKGKRVEVFYAYKEQKLVAISVASGNVTSDYILNGEVPVQETVVQN